MKNSRQIADGLPQNVSAAAKQGGFRVSRRKFLLSAAAGITLPSLTRAQQGQNAIFFNLSHLDWESTEHHLVVAGRRLPLTKVKSNRAVLDTARRTNRFLELVPDDQITHHLEASALTTDISTLGYIVGNSDPSTGTWSMSMIVQFLAPTSTPAAFTAAQIRNPQGGPLGLSAKRFTYGQRAALSVDDMLEEQALVDSTDHARTLIGLHPDLVTADLDTASVIHNTHILTSSRVRFLAGVLRSRGDATPEITPGQPNPQGWAKLVPITQDDGTPFRNNQGLNQYFADWHPLVDEQVASSVPDILDTVKDDTTLGDDVTPYSDADPQAPIQGKVWFRRDGISNVTRQASPTLAAGSGKIWDFQQQNGDAGLVVRDPKVVVNADNTVTVTLDNIDNWFLRFLGMYLQFIDVQDQVMPVSSLPSNVIAERVTVSSPLDKDNYLFAGIVPNPFAVAGIPIYPPGRVTCTVNIPPDAKMMKVFLGGLSLRDPTEAPDDLGEVGASMTFAFNYGLVTLFMAMGSSTLAPVFKLVAGLAGQTIAQAVLSTLGPTLAKRKLDVGTGTAVAINFIKGLLNGLAGKGLTELVAAIGGSLISAQIIDAVPVVGQIARAVAAGIGAAQILETSIELGLSPTLYEFDLVLTHSLSVRIYPDIQNRQFPEEPGYTLYYKVSWLSDNGTTPHTQPAVDVPDPDIPYIDVILPDLPRGGQVNIMVGFYMREMSTPAGQNDWCAGRGSTGLVSNLVDTAPDIRITQIKIPIDKNTRYIHTRKTALDTNGSHIWVDTQTPPLYTPPSGSQAPGSLNALRSITVRQGTATQKGYLGYAWQAYSSGLLDCNTQAPGQLDQAANLNTDPHAAQDGYVATNCGLQGGALSGIKIAYSLLGDGDNYYLDTSTLIVRKINLDIPGFDRPNLDQAWGKLNYDSTSLLLHPAGHIVSINNAYHKLEALKLPGNFVADVDAGRLHSAVPRSGKGTRPGLMKSPVAAAVSPDGHIVVLEDCSANNRLQAFDIGGNSMPIFEKQRSPYFLQLTATPDVTYLDLAIEYTGYIYVLSRNPTTAQFRLDIYHPTQDGTLPICTTTGVAAARIAVDLWRSLYTLNYEVLRTPSGTFPDRTEPSVSQWIPSLPV